MQTVRKGCFLYKYSRAFWLLLACLVVAGCGGTSGVKAPPSSEQSTPEQYRIGIGDNLNISVWKNPELSVAVPVRPDGNISMPLIGDVRAGGATTDELAERVEAKLKDFVRTPEVTVIVTNPSSSDFQNRVRITGAINQQLSVPFREGMTIMDLVLDAGGLSDFAVANKALLYRKDADGKLNAYTIRLNDILYKGDLETNYTLQPSDVITIPERKF